MPNIIDTGVAKPKAQGQLITNTATPAKMELVISFPLSNQQAVVITAMSITAGTKIEHTLSAIRPIGAFEALAFCTNSITVA